MTNYTDILEGQELITESFNLVHILQTEWLVGLLATFLILLLITRNISKWGEWGLPVSIFVMIIGINVSLVQMIGSGVIFAISILQGNVLGNFIDSTVTPLIKRAESKENKEYKQLLKKEFKSRQRKAAKTMGHIDLAEKLGIKRK